MFIDISLYIYDVIHNFSHNDVLDSRCYSSAKGLRNASHVCTFKLTSRTTLRGLRLSVTTCVTDRIGVLCNKFSYKFQLALILISNFF